MRIRSNRSFAQCETADWPSLSQTLATSQHGQIALGDRPVDIVVFDDKDVSGHLWKEISARAIYGRARSLDWRAPVGHSLSQRRDGVAKGIALNGASLKS
jgi:hypothetical protein